MEREVKEAEVALWREVHACSNHPILEVYRARQDEKKEDMDDGDDEKGISATDQELFPPRASTGEVLLTDIVMEATVSASLGAMGSLRRKLEKSVDLENWAASDAVKDEIKQLRTDVGSTHDLLLKLSEVKDPPNTVRYWMKDVRELSYDMEDWIDHFIHLDDDVKNDFIGKISGFKARLEEMKDRYVRYKLTDCLNSSTSTSNMAIGSCPAWITGRSAGMEPVEGRITVGIEDPMNEIIERLRTDRERQLKVVSIVGVQGVGKTTLAQKVWHKLGGQFECRAFVQTTKKPDMRGILRNILTQVNPHQPTDACEVHKLVHDLREYLQKKRYFIIVEDLWVISAWDVLSRGFLDNNNCSRIITTTTIEDIALACCNHEAERVFKMKPLSMSLSKKLFVDVVFGSGKECPEQFNGVLDEITRKCGGLPLAIICLAHNLVASQPETLKHWELVQYFLHDSLRTNPTPEEILEVVLELCYSTLPQYLKTCLMYLSVYTENYMILKDELVKQWAAEGFISAKQGKDVLEVGENCFDELVNLGLIQHMDIHCNDEMSYYVVSHMVLDLITRKSIEDNFAIVIDYSQTKIGLSEKVRRLSLHFGSATYATTPASINLSQVRSLTFVGLLKCMPSIKDFKLLRVAILHIWGHDKNRCFNLTAIRQLFRLIYLQIRCNVAVKLPLETMYCLRHLETLEINAAVPSDDQRTPSLLYLHPGREKNMPTTNASTKYIMVDPTDLSSASTCPDPPIFLQTLELLPLSRLPKWIQQLEKLSILKIMVRELRRNDIGVLAGLPALTVLCLYVHQPTAEKLTFQTGNFPVLKYLEFMCDVLFLEFEEKAMPNLRKLKIGFNAHKEEKYGNMLAGIEHLLSLKEIAGKIGAATDAEESDKRDAESAFRYAISKHPCCRNFDVSREDQVDEDYRPSEIQNWDEDKDSSSEQHWDPNKQLWMQKENLSNEKPEKMENRSDDTKKCADSRISQVSIEQEIHLSPLLKSEGSTSAGGNILQNELLHQTHMLRAVTIQFLENITDHFSEERIIGIGRYGMVYKGVLENGEEIAVKKLSHRLLPDDDDDDVQLESELINLTNVQHQNIARVVGYCYETEDKVVPYDGQYVTAQLEEIRALCFEYFQPGSLNKYLSDESGGLDWCTRYIIIKGICEGVNYLHNGRQDCIYHLDLKPGNILLDKNNIPKIADFGLSRFFGITPSHHTTKRLIGTDGYLPPEYVERNQISEKFDVFSLGVIIIEIITGPKEQSKRADMSSQQFIDLAHENWKKRWQATPMYTTEELDNLQLQVKTCMEMMLQCVEDDPVKRPTIAEVVDRLNKLDDTIQRSLPMLLPSRSPDQASPRGQV